jgi:cold shock CspA family protein
MIVIIHEDGKKIIHYMKRMIPVSPMRGVIKFINKEKAYGFITSNNVDFYFRTNKLTNDLIQKDSLVEFTAEIGKRGETVSNIKLI